MAIAPSDMLCFALHSTAHAVHAAYAPLLQPLGLTYPQYLAISALGTRDGMTVSQLGAELRLDSNTLTPLLKRMEAAGWITRSRDTRDERQVRLSLTEAGRALSLKLADVPKAFAAKTGLQMSEIADLRDILAALRDKLKPARS
ncbi:MarR family winged helix-turn-helix transcriptional regulator [Rhodobacter calidifons]|uniref:MarR family transcriptional regulator n=1 Tax=Rhodobacter calidifons TaxID=2715277 RepID=A0ABX0G3A2_9RHOB|nr:MarR family transcriptional regulator [Rhodobacter calidifons]NHB75686.1 MarR family transcriptional regulator [Rhodobacter calidifons]